MYIYTQIYICRLSAPVYQHIPRHSANTSTTSNILVNLPRVLWPGREPTSSPRTTLGLTPRAGFSPVLFISFWSHVLCTSLCTSQRALFLSLSLRWRALRIVCISLQIETERCLVQCNTHTPQPASSHHAPIVGAYLGNTSPAVNYQVSSFEIGAAR